MGSNNRVKQRFDKEVEDWERIYNLKEKDIIAWEAHRRLELTREILKKYEGKRITIIDIGCGTGRNLASLISKERKWKGIGIDISKGMIQHAKKAYGNRRLTYTQGDIEKRRPATKVDIVIALGVVGYPQDNSRFFEQVSHLLKKDGICIFTYGDKYSINRWLMKLLASVYFSKIVQKPLSLVTKREREKPELHFRLYGWRELEASLNGLQRIDSYNIAFGPGIPGKVAIGIGKQLEKLFLKKDPLHLSLTKMIVVQK